MKNEINEEIERLLKKSSYDLNNSLNSEAMGILTGSDYGETTTTATCQPQQIVTLEDWKETIKQLSLHTYKIPEFPKESQTWLQKKFEKIMNRFGWYRQTTVYLIDFNAISKPYNEFVRFKDEKYDYKD
jgi:hypothetical protein